MNMLVKKIDISRLKTYEEQIDDEKMRERSKEFKKVRVDGGGYSNQRSRSDGGGRTQDRKFGHHAKDCKS